ncbi:hypothetical protein D3C73_1275990 [compost metagenome]
MLGQATDGNAVHAIFSDRTQAAEADAAGHFQWNTTFGDAHRFAPQFRAEVVQQDAFTAGLQRLPQLVQVLDLDYQRQLWPLPAGGRHRGSQ